VCSFFLHGDVFFVLNDYVSATITIVIATPIIIVSVAYHITGRRSTTISTLLLVLVLLICK
jgi:hypothetical protein